MGFYLSAFEQWDFSFLSSIRRKLTCKQTTNMISRDWYYFCLFSTWMLWSGEYLAEKMWKKQNHHPSSPQKGALSLSECIYVFVKHKHALYEWKLKVLKKYHRMLFLSWRQLLELIGFWIFWNNLKFQLLISGCGCCCENRTELSVSHRFLCSWLPWLFKNQTTEVQWRVSLCLYSVFAAFSMKFTLLLIFTEDLSFYLSNDKE